MADSDKNKGIMNKLGKPIQQTWISWYTNRGTAPGINKWTSFSAVIRRVKRSAKAQYLVCVSGGRYFSETCPTSVYVCDFSKIENRFSSHCCMRWERIQWHFCPLTPLGPDQFSAFHLSKSNRLFLNQQPILHQFYVPLSSLKGKYFLTEQPCAPFSMLSGSSNNQVQY